MDNAINGCYRLSWRERLGFCSGDLAQNLIPAVLFVLAIFVIGKYELSDEKMDELNAAVTKR